MFQQGPDRLVSAAAHKPAPDTGSPEEEDEEVSPQGPEAPEATKAPEAPEAPAQVGEQSHQLEAPSLAECEEAGAAGHVTLSDQVAPTKMSPPRPAVTMVTGQTLASVPTSQSKKATENTRKTTEQTQCDNKTACQLAVSETMSIETSEQAPVTKTTPGTSANYCLD